MDTANLHKLPLNTCIQFKECYQEDWTIILHGITFPIPYDCQQAAPDKSLSVSQPHCILPAHRVSVTSLLVPLCHHIPSTDMASEIDVWRQWNGVVVPSILAGIHYVSFKKHYLHLQLITCTRSCWYYFCISRGKLNGKAEWHSCAGNMGPNSTRN